MKKYFTLAVLLCIALISGSQVVNSKHKGLKYKTVECSELNQKLQGKIKPIVVFCGDLRDEKDKYTYGFKKIPGSLVIGSVNQDKWEENLRAALLLAELDKSFKSEVVVYCGCCSSDNCPNVEPVILELKRMGFKNVKGLYFSEGYLPEWHAKKYLEEPLK
jgi:hypothetical protein